MSEIETEYRELRERSRRIAQRMDRRLFGAMIFSVVALVEAGGLAYNEVHNHGKVDGVTGIAAAGFIFGVGLATQYTREYKGLKPQLLESQEDFYAFRNNVLYPPAPEVPPMEGWNVIDINDLNGSSGNDSY